MHLRLPGLDMRIQPRENWEQLAIALIKIGLIASSCLLAIWLLLAHCGVLSPINAGSPDLSSPVLLGIVLLHIVFGTFLFMGTITAGLAVLSLAPQRWSLIPTDYFILSPMIGLLLWLIVCLAVRLLGGGSYLILGLIFSIAALRLPQILRLRDARNRMSSVLAVRLRWKTLLLIYALNVALSAHLGLLWRLPSENIRGTVDLGDLAYLTGAFHSLKISLYPWMSYSVEGEYFHPFNQLQNFLALGFDSIPGFEISLFLTTSVSLFFCLSTVFVIANMYRYRIAVGSAPLDAATTCTIILLLCTAIRYPSWLVETPPVAFAVPLALSIVYLIDRGKERVGFYYLAIPAAVIAFALSKVTIITVFGLYGFSMLSVRTWSDRSRAGLIALVIGSAMIAAFSALLLMLFWHKFISFATVNDFGPPSLQTFHYYLLKGTRLLKAIRKTTPAFTFDLGLLLLVLGVWRLRSYSLFIAILGGTLLYYSYSYLFYPTAAAAFILTLGWLLLCATQQAAIHRRAMIYFAVSGALVLCSYFMRDPGGWLLVLIWTSTFGGSLVLLLYGETTSASGSKLRCRWSAFGDTWRYALSAIALMSVFAHANGDLRFDIPNRQVVPLSLSDLWVNVRHFTPLDALIFTDQTGQNPTRLEGWNDLSMMAARQFYISSWATSFLRGDATARSKRLVDNSAVLDGKIRPEELQSKLHRSYSSYYAAVRTSYPVPVTFEKIYSNDDYVIYRIP